MLIVIGHSPRSYPGKAVSDAALAALNNEVDKRVPHRFVPAPWAANEAEVHCAPFVLVEGEARQHRDPSGELRTPWAWRISYAVSVIWWFGEEPSDGAPAPIASTTRQIIGEPVALLPHQDSWDTPDGVDMSVVADAIATAAAAAPQSVPRELRLGQAAVRWHLAQREAADARLSMLDRARNEAQWPNPPTSADQARRVGLSKQTWGRWQRAEEDSPGLENDS